MGRIEYEYPLFKVYYSNNSNNSNIRGNPVSTIYSHGWALYWWAASEQPHHPQTLSPACGRNLPPTGPHRSAEERPHACLQNCHGPELRVWNVLMDYHGSFITSRPGCCRCRGWGFLYCGCSDDACNTSYATDWLTYFTFIPALQKRGIWHHWLQRLRAVEEWSWDSGDI